MNLMSGVLESEAEMQNCTYLSLELLGLLLFTVTDTQNLRMFQMRRYYYRYHL